MVSTYQDARELFKLQTKTRTGPYVENKTRPDKIREELSELEEQINDYGEAQSRESPEELAGIATNIQREYGDLLANVLLLGAELGIGDPDQAARLCLGKIYHRLSFVLANIESEQNSPEWAGEVVRLWKKAKALER